MEKPSTSYDTVPYPSYTHPQTHPDRLEVIGTLLGLSPAPATRCRVLEVGCGDGTNLAPMAWALPQSEFVGIDLAARPIAEGQRMIRELGLGNIRLVHGSIAEIDDSWGRYDYVIAHGFYSWVPAENQAQLLALCHRALNPHGIAFISYSTFPGGHLQTMLREMLRFHTRECATPQARVDQALALTHFLAEAQDTQDEFRVWMKAALKTVSQHEEGHLYHDELAEINEPLYFTQFIQRAARHELQYLAEADYFEMSDHGFKDSVRESLSQLARNRILREQYLDFLKCRRFRQTLLCHRECRLQLEPEARHVSRFSIASGARRASGPAELEAPGSCTFEAPKGGRCNTDYVLGKAALTILGRDLASVHSLQGTPGTIGEAITKHRPFRRAGIRPPGSTRRVPASTCTARDCGIPCRGAGGCRQRRRTPHREPDRPMAGGRRSFGNVPVSYLRESGGRNWPADSHLAGWKLRSPRPSGKTLGVLESQGRSQFVRGGRGRRETQT